MNSRPIVFLGIVIILIAVVAAVGYVIHDRVPDTASLPLPISPVSTSTPVESSVPTASSTPGNTMPLPGQRHPPIDTSSWLIHPDNKSGYSIEYPPNLITGSNNGRFTAAFPKNTYFHWPLLDDVKVTVSASSGACPEIETPRAASDDPVEFTLNGYKFKRTIGTDIGAGQRYQEIVYDLLLDDTCYRVDLLAHGANGAGLYVDDASLVKKYDAQQEADMTAVVDILNRMVSTLRILARTP